MNISDVANTTSNHHDDEDFVLMVSEDWDGHTTNDVDEFDHQFYGTTEVVINRTDVDIFTNDPEDPEEFQFCCSFDRSKINCFSKKKQDVVVTKRSEVDKFLDSQNTIIR